jgi:ABC-2 type transport system permease protein
MTTSALPVAASTSRPTVDRTATRTSTDDLRALPAALRSEWIKLTALRANTVILALTAAIGAVIAGGLAATTTDRALTASELFIYPLPLVAMLASVTGILMFTGEAQHGTLAITLMARPARWVTVTAKTVTAAGVGAALGAIGMVAGFAGAAVGGVELGSGSHLVSRAAWALLYIVLAALVGLGVGMIVRHSAGAVSGVLVWWFVIEGLLIQFAPAEVVRFLPFDAGFRTLGAGPSYDSPEFVAAALSNTLHAAIFWGYVLAALAIGTTLLHRRDAD